MRLHLKLEALVVWLMVILVTVSCSQPDKNARFKTQRSGFVQVDQAKLFYQSFGTGTPIIVLHGGPGLDQTYLLPQMLTLAKDHEVIFYDQRGSGKSLDTNMSPTYLNTVQFVKDLEALRIQLGLNKVVLLGHSWGGFLAMNYAIAHPDHVSALILMNTGPADYKGQQAFAVEFSKRTQPIKNEISALGNPSAFEQSSSANITKMYKVLFSVYFYNPKDESELSLNMTEKSEKSGFKVLEVMNETSWMKPEINLYPQLEKLNVPTLIVHGKEDIIPLWTAEKIKAAIPGAQMITLEECGHFSYIEKPDQVFSRIDLFLNDVSNNNAP